MSNYKINVEKLFPAIKIETNKIKALVKKVLAEEKISCAEITIIFVNDNYIIKLNKQFLKKDDTTDVLSFNLNDDLVGRSLEGEVYLNIEQIKRQTVDYGVSFNNELHRVLAHGVLHLIGYNDTTIRERQIMTEKENYYLAVPGEPKVQKNMMHYG